MAEIFKRVTEISVGQSGNIYLLCKEILEKESSRGKYLQMTLFDGKNEIKAFQWEASKETTMAVVGEVMAVVLNIGTYRDNISYTIKQCRRLVPKDNVNIAEFIPSVPCNSEKMYSEIMNVLEKMQNLEIAQLVKTIYEENKEQLFTWTAAKRAHHNILGGLLYHSYRMMKQAVVTADVYPALNKDIMIAGCLLHDIGKLKELDINQLGVTSYSVDGTLLGHILIGSDIVKEYGEKLKINPEIIRILRHIIASHHGSLEHGSPVLPSIQEAIIIHQLDMIDSRMYMLEEANEKLESGSLASERNYFLDNVVLYKPNI